MHGVPQFHQSFKTESFFKNISDYILKIISLNFEKIINYKNLRKNDFSEKHAY